MTGNDLIKFIIENKLENAEVIDSGCSHVVQFGCWGIKNSDNAHDTIAYSICPDVEDHYTTNIEAYYANEETGNGTTNILTTEEALEIREERYSWDDLYKLARGTAWFDPWCKAKDEARYQVQQLVLEKENVDIEKDECPEEEVDRYTSNWDICFDRDGNITRYIE